MINIQHFFTWFNILLIIIIYHAFLPPPRRDSHVKADNTHTKSLKIHTLAHILDTCPFIFSNCALFTVYHNCIPPLSPQVITTRAREGSQKEHRAKQKRNSLSYICTRAFHSFLPFAYYRTASLVIPLLPKATFTTSIQPNLCLPRTCNPLTSAINTFLAIRYSSILSHAQTISILSDLLYSLTPFLFQLSYTPLHS